jgi:hypothetical protein
MDCSWAAIKFCSTQMVQLLSTLWLPSSPYNYMLEMPSLIWGKRSCSEKLTVLLEIRSYTKNYSIRRIWEEAVVWLGYLSEFPDDLLHTKPGSRLTSFISLRRVWPSGLIHQKDGTVFLTACYHSLQELYLQMIICMDGMKACSFL